jgi:hypothetical protein
MEQIPKTNIDQRTIVTDPRILEKRVVQEHRPKKYSDELAVSDPHQFFGIDRNLIITLAVVGISLGLSMYLFREIKKIRDDVRTLKSQEPDSELIEKVEENSESVKAIETKLDQLITALGTQQRRYQQMQQPQMQQSQMQQPQMQQQPPQVNEQEYQNQQILNQMAQQQMAQQQMAQQQMEQQQMELQQQQQQQMNKSLQVPVMGGRISGSSITMDDPGIINI